ncbi:endonuclease/exonuclease/phosphatase family protein [Amycolatopsis dongchuanensis]|uniref:Endonuclease/exonuclease/phosphatase family protein n=1 Tax=Amycolatopsis dongchuanensis TaxID=1070866 RepID=A0ABP9PWI7_9PSEU
MTTSRIATFNLENFDETAPDAHPSLDERITLMRPQIERLRADIVCFQEVNGQERDGQPRDLHALRRLLEDTNLDAAETVSTRTATKEVFDERNLVVASLYRQSTADPPDETAEPVEIERPILHVEISVDEKPLHVINVHLKSKLPSEVAGRKIDAFTWKTADSWAEGAFISSMKRMSQAVEVRRLVDRILDDDADARIVVAGDFNATPEEVPVLAIRGAVEDTVPEPARYTLYHQGKGQLLHDESAAFADDRKYPESDHAPVVAAFEF